MDEGLDRHLAAILALDIAGYSRMMGADERGTLDRLLRRRQEAIDPMVGDHRGRVVKGTGDGILAEFGSAQDAIRCAIAIQQALADANAAEPAESPMMARIGITLGDVFFEPDGDIFGDGVNIAARLESKAPSGGICVSARALDDLHRVGVPFSDFGEIRLKNIERPVRVYCIHPDGVASVRRSLLVNRRTAIIGGATLATAVVGGGGWFWTRGRHREDGGSIAVMPFANLSGDPAQAYFSDGLAEEMRNALARIPALKVIARTSSEKLRDTDAMEAARTLRVGNILTGSVRRSPSLIRVSAQLVDGSNGVERWSQSYDRAPGDILSIQSSIAQNVAQALSVTLGLQDKAAITAGGSSNAVAHDLYLKAETIYYATATEADSRRALAMLDAAIALDARYADAYALESVIQQYLATFFAPSATAAREGLSEAETSARKAVLFAPSLPDAHASLGRVLATELRLKAGEQEFRKAQALGETGLLLRRYSEFLAEIGRSDEALPMAARAVSLDPLDAKAVLSQSWVLYLARRYVEALAAASHAIQQAPSRNYAQYFVALPLLALDKRAALRALAKLPEDSLQRLTGEAVAKAHLGDRAGSDRALSRLKQIAGDAAAYQSAEIYAQRGELDQAFGALDQAYSVRDSALLWLPSDPLIDPLRSDPRFKALVSKLDFP